MMGTMPKQRIDTEDVAEAALDVIDASGAEDLTLAKVADELGVQSSALYNHVEGLSGLRQTVAERSSESLAFTLREAAIARSGMDAVRSVGAAYRRFASEHPGQFAAAALTFGDVTREMTDATTSITLLLARIVEGLGAEGSRALDDARALHSAIRGFVLLEATEGLDPAADADHAFEHLLELVAGAIRREWS